MGKRYHCVHCNKTMVSSPSIVKTHNKGLAHQMLVTEHYQQYKDAETILSEESVKKPCSRFPKGQCQFGTLCRFSHYTGAYLNQLREIVAAKSRENMEDTQPSFEDLYQKLQDEKSKPDTSDCEATTLYDDTGITHIFPWTYNINFDSYGENLPPSIKRLSAEDFKNADITSWG